MRCVERQVLRELARTTELSELSAGFEVTARRPWASSLFVGTRFTIACAVDDDADAFDWWLAELPELEILLSGHFVASAEVIERGAERAMIELLVVEES